MRLRVLLQFVAIVIIMLTIWACMIGPIRRDRAAAMVVLNESTRAPATTARTALGNGERRKKYDLRVAAYGTLDEVNAVIGLARLHAGDDPALDAMLARIQNDLFDVEADLCMPPTRARVRAARGSTVTDAQVEWLEQQIDHAQRRSCAAAIVHPAGRQRRRGLPASRAHGLPARRAHDGRAQRPAGRKRHAGGAQIRQPAVGLPVRRRPASPTTRARPTCCGCRARTGEGRRMVVPIYDDNPFTQPVKPVVTWCLIAGNLAVFLYEIGGRAARARAHDRHLQPHPGGAVRRHAVAGRLPPCSRWSPTSSSMPTLCTCSAT